MKICHQGPVIFLMLVLPIAGAVGQEADAGAAEKRGDATRSGWEVTLPAVKTLGLQALPARFQRQPLPAQPTAVATRPTFAADGAGSERDEALREQTLDYEGRSQLLDRLQEFDGLRGLTFYESDSFSLFFGVSREGFAGLNLRQRTTPAPVSRLQDDERRYPVAGFRLSTAL